MKTSYQLQSLCGICGKSCTIRPIEKTKHLKGIRLRAIHEDGSIHEYSQFKSLADMGRQDKNNPVRIVCPKCGKRGRVGEFKTYAKSTKNDNTHFYIAHEKTKGTWGKAKINKVRRCYIYNSNKELRDIILKKLGRYIE